MIKRVSYRILVTGSRDWTDAKIIRETLLNAAHGVLFGIPIVLVHGDAPGADTIAADIATNLGWRVEPHPAQWDTHTEQCPPWHWDLPECKMAGHRRNQEMVNSRADVCLAYIKNQSRGATSCADRAEAAYIPTFRYREDGG